MPIPTPAATESATVAGARISAAIWVPSNTTSMIAFAQGATPHTESVSVRVNTRRPQRVVAGLVERPRRLLEVHLAV